jgi:hypothetical protein
MTWIPNFSCSFKIAMTFFYIKKKKDLAYNIPHYLLVGNYTWLSDKNEGPTSQVDQLFL